MDFLFTFYSYRASVNFVYILWCWSPPRDRMLLLIFNNSLLYVILVCCRLLLVGHLNHTLSLYFVERLLKLDHQLYLLLTVGFEVLLRQLRERMMTYSICVIFVFMLRRALGWWVTDILLLPWKWNLLAYRRGKEFLIYVYQ